MLETLNLCSLGISLPVADSRTRAFFSMSLRPPTWQRDLFYLFYFIPFIGLLQPRLRDTARATQVHHLEATWAQMESARVRLTSGLAPATFFLIRSLPTSVFGGAFSQRSLDKGVTLQIFLCKCFFKEIFAKTKVLEAEDLMRKLQGYQIF